MPRTKTKKCPKCKGECYCLLPHPDFMNRWWCKDCDWESPLFKEEEDVFVKKEK